MHVCVYIYIYNYLNTYISHSTNDVTFARGRGSSSFHQNVTVVFHRSVAGGEGQRVDGVHPPQKEAAVSATFLEGGEWVGVGIQRSRNGVRGSVVR